MEPKLSEFMAAATPAERQRAQTDPTWCDSVPTCKKATCMHHVFLILHMALLLYACRLRKRVPHTVPPKRQVAEGMLDALVAHIGVHDLSTGHPLISPALLDVAVRQIYLVLENAIRGMTVLH